MHIANGSRLYNTCRQYLYPNTFQGYSARADHTSLDVHHHSCSCDPRAVLIEVIEDHRRFALDRKRTSTPAVEGSAGTGTALLTFDQCHAMFLLCDWQVEAYVA